MPKSVLLVLRTSRSIGFQCHLIHAAPTFVSEDDEGVILPLQGNLAVKPWEAIGDTEMPLWQDGDRPYVLGAPSPRYPF